MQEEKHAQPVINYTAKELDNITMSSVPQIRTSSASCHYYYYLAYRARKANRDTGITAVKLLSSLDYGFARWKRRRNQSEALVLEVLVKYYKFASFLSRSSKGKNEDKKRGGLGARAPS